jgi:uncharacterized lipoprotein YajG
LSLPTEKLKREIMNKKIIFTLLCFLIATPCLAAAPPTTTQTPEPAPTTIDCRIQTCLFLNSNFD